MKGKIYGVEINAYNFHELWHLWEPYAQKDTSSIYFIFARFTISTRATTGFGMKDCLSLLSVVWKNFNETVCGENPF